MELWDPAAVSSARPLPPGQSAGEHVQQLEEVKIEPGLSFGETQGRKGPKLLSVAALARLLLTGAL